MPSPIVKQSLPKPSFHHKLTLSAVFVFSLFSSTLVMASQSPAGKVKTYNQQGWVINQGVSRELKVGDNIYVGDEIRTKRRGSVGITFQDGAVMSIGSNSQVMIDSFLFEPESNNVGFVSRVKKGTLSFISGAIGRIAPERVKIQTPTATLGLRGTKILVEVK